MQMNSFAFSQCPHLHGDRLLPGEVHWSHKKKSHLLHLMPQSSVKPITSSENLFFFFFLIICYFYFSKKMLVPVPFPKAYCVPSPVEGGTGSK